MQADELGAIDQISMLDIRALQRLMEMASVCRGGILEIGPYFGGSTVALAL